MFPFTCDVSSEKKEKSGSLLTQPLYFFGHQSFLCGH